MSMYFVQIVSDNDFAGGMQLLGNFLLLHISTYAAGTARLVIMG